MKKISISFVSIFMVLFCSVYALASPIGKVTVKVIGEDDVPIQGADARVTFKFGKKGGWGLNTKAEEGVTNKKGLFVTSGSGMASISISARKEGYYKSGKGYQFPARNKLLNRWEPWNPTVEVVLKKKRNPVAMYMKGGTSTPIPVFDQPVGYDLEKGDWVAPYGVGVINDFIFNCKYNRVDFNNAEASCEITFSNEKDGVQEFIFDDKDQSYYKWPFEAPQMNYKKSLHKWMTLHFPGEGYKSNINDQTNYIFRVRTKTDKDGDIIAANYGKVERDFLVSRKGKVKFYYYFNPDGTRNLEEDPDKNLFKNR